MSKLKAATRNALPSTEFAGPDRSYPVEDKAHAANAKARVANKSPALKRRVDAKANKVLKACSGTSMVPGYAKGTAKVPPPNKGPLNPSTLGSMVNSLKGINK